MEENSFGIRLRLTCRNWSPDGKIRLHPTAKSGTSFLCNSGSGMIFFISASKCCLAWDCKIVPFMYMAIKCYSFSSITRYRPVYSLKKLFKVLSFSSRRFKTASGSLASLCLSAGTNLPCLELTDGNDHRGVRTKTFTVLTIGWMAGRIWALDAPDPTKRTFLPSSETLSSHCAL